MVVINALELFPKKSIQRWKKTGIFISYVFYKNKEMETTYILNKKGLTEAHYGLNYVSPEKIC